MRRVVPPPSPRVVRAVAQEDARATARVAWRYVRRAARTRRSVFVEEPGWRCATSGFYSRRGPGVIRNQAAYWIDRANSLRCYSPEGARSCLGVAALLRPFISPLP